MEDDLLTLSHGGMVMPRTKRGNGTVEKNKIIAGLEDAVEFARGDTDRGRISTVAVPNAVDVRAIRRRLNMSQQEFAMCFGFVLGTLRNWEQGRRTPRGPERVLLTLIDRIPDQVQEALRAA